MNGKKVQLDGVDRVKLEELIFDFTIYPRQMVDRHNVNRIKDAIQAGRYLPPVTIDRASKRIVDGFHRVKAALELEETEIDVRFCDYASETDLRLDAIALNSAHGRALTPFEIARCLLLGGRARIKAEKLAKALGITMDRLREIRASREAQVIHAGHPDEQIVLKRTVTHLVGQDISEEQAEAAAKCGGMRAVYYVNQVVNLVEGGLIDATDEALAERLRYLARLLEQRLAVTA